MRYLIHKSSVTLPMCLFTNKSSAEFIPTEGNSFSLRVCKQSSVSEMVPALEGLGFHPNTDKFYIPINLCYWFQCSKTKSYKKTKLLEVWHAIRTGRWGPGLFWGSEVPPTHQSVHEFVLRRFLPRKMLLQILNCLSKALGDL